MSLMIISTSIEIIGVWAIEIAPQTVLQIDNCHDI